MGKWVNFELIDDTGKTKRWQVVTQEPWKRVLGSIHWFGRWRQYAFFPLQNTVYERQCLRDIADFCEERTKEHRTALASAKETVSA